ncbi:MAG: energy transducer TonB [Chitinophagales bacterium]|nr:energy transducer TonB [Chitinophagaceae bacterium]MCB9065575.1 energy transducer TonB [Chitinophagales bacterium]
MKKFIPLLLLMLASFATEAQYVDSLKQYLDSSYNTVAKEDGFVYLRVARKAETGSWMVEDYYNETATLKMEGVFSDDSLKVPEGRVNNFHLNGNLSSTGKYYHGIRVGLWLNYHINGIRADSMYFKLNGMPYHQAYHWDEMGNMIGYDEFDMNGSGAGKSLSYYDDSTLSGEGKYTIGNLKDSIWVYYRTDGSVSAKEYYDSGDFRKYECYDKEGNLYSNSCDTSLIHAHPRYDERIFLAMNTKMPREALEVGDFGKHIVVIGFTVNRDGRLSNFTIVQSSKDYYNAEAYRVVSSLPSWVPAYYKNRSIKTFQTIPVTFIIE